MPPAKKKKFIWAIDPYGEAKVQSSAAELAKSLSQHNDLQVIYIHGRSGFLIENNVRLNNSWVKFGIGSRKLSSFQAYSKAGLLGLDLI